MSRAADILLRLGDTNPIVPTSGQISFYAKDNGIFYSLDSNGIETPLFGGTGTVTSIDVGGGTTGLTTIGGPVTTNGTITLTGTLFETHGGTGVNTYITGDMLYASAANTLSKRSIGADGQVLTVSGGVPTWSTVSGTGTVTSVAMTVPDFLSVTGSPITSSGTLAVSLSGTALPIANGGTGANTANSAFNALAPTQTGNAGKFLTTDGTDTSWATISGTGTVTSVEVSGGTTGLTTTGGPVTESGTITLAGILNIANGGTGANTAPEARTNLGATTVGSNFFTLTDPGAVTFTRINADNSVSALDAESFRTAIGAGTSSTTGTVTSIEVSGGTTGLTTTGGPVTGSGTITLAGTLAVANGGTGATELTGYIKGNGTSAFTANNSIPSTDITGLGDLSTINKDNVATHVLLGTGVFGNVPIGGNDTEILFNNLGVSDGSNNFVYNDATSTVKIGGDLNYADSTKLSVVENKDGFGQVLFQNKNAGSNASMNLAIVNNSAGTDYMAIGINSSAFSEVYNTLFELPNAGYISNTTDVIIGAQSDHSSASRTYFTYASGSNALELNEYGALGWGASYNGTLTQANFGTAGQVLVSAGPSAPPAWTNISSSGTVTSVEVSGGTTGLTTSGGPVTESGTITLAGILNIANGGTGANTANSAFNALAPTQTGNSGKFLTTDGTDTSWATISGTGTVTSIEVSGGTTGLTTTGGPVTGSGTITLSGTLAITNGGTGANTAPDARTNLGASIVGGNIFTLANPGAVTYLRVNADNSVSALDADSFRTAIGAGTSSTTGTVTSVDISGGTTGLTTTGGPVTGSGIITLSGTLAIANGGTGANTAPDARTNLGATTIGGNLFTLTNPGAITFPRFNADNSVSALDAASFRTAIGAGTSSTTGTVTSVAMTVPAFLSVTGSPVTSSGTLAVSLSGTALPIANGGTGATTANTAFNALAPAQTGNSGKFLTTDGTTTSWSTVSGTGTVTSVDVSGGTTGLTTTGGPVTGSGTITLAGTLALANGGTGATTQSGAANAILPTQTGNSGKVLTTDGSTVSWTTVSGTGTVTSVGATGNNGVTVSGSPITSSGTITIGLDNITPINVAATGTVTGTNLSGTNTGDQTITLTGDVTGTGTGSFATTLADTTVTAGVYGSSTQVPVITVDSKGRITNVSNTAISGSGSSAPEVVVWHYSSGNGGNFSAVDALYSATSGVTPAITDAANCIATYSFSGKSNLPKSMTIYGQVYSTNSFQIKTTTSLAKAEVAGGGTAATPDLVSGVFSASNLVTLQTRMSDVGASAGLGQRAWLIVVFGF